jgi:hypothetical protein
MILPYIETDRPIPSERTMRQVNHTQSRNGKEKPRPTDQGIKAVSRETRLAFPFRGAVAPAVPNCIYFREFPFAAGCHFGE